MLLGIYKCKCGAEIHPATMGGTFMEKMMEITNHFDHGGFDKIGEEESNEENL